MKNIDRFNEACALIFAKLLEKFPSPQILDVWTMVPPDDGERAGRRTETTEFRVLMGHAIHFLIQEEFIRGNPNGDYDCARFNNVVLTGKGLEKLRAIPNALQDKKQPLGEAILEWAKDFGKGIAKDVLGDLFKGIFSG